ncbi:MAG: CnrY/NccY family anti-sigma factor [Rhodanobacter sp.]|nr:CnrY/NccY family anti-sigma factor [Rhodanobacter sp.]
MPTLDEWLTQASHATWSPPSSTEAEALLEYRLGREPAPAAWQSRRDMRRTVLSVALATLVGFVGSDWIVNTVWSGSTNPMWVAAPPAMSPYGLLVAR